MFRKWLDALGLEIEYANRRKYYICSRHFSPEMTFPDNKNRTTLKATAVPVLFLTGMFDYFKLQDYISELYLLFLFRLVNN